MKYILSQGAKEGLVLSPKDWPGVHAAKALAEGSPLRGLWIDRTKLYAARQKRKDTSEAEFSHEEELHLKPLPCWADLDKDRRKRKVRTMLKRIEQSTLAMHQEAGTVPLGASAVLSRQPHERAKRLVKSPMPRFHAATKKVRQLLFDGYREFYAVPPGRREARSWRSRSNLPGELLSTWPALRRASADLAVSPSSAHKSKASYPRSTLEPLVELCLQNGIFGSFSKFGLMK